MCRALVTLGSAELSNCRLPAGMISTTRHLSCAARSEPLTPSLLYGQGCHSAQYERLCLKSFRRQGDIRIHWDSRLSFSHFSSMLGRESWGGRCGGETRGHRADAKLRRRVSAESDDPLPSFVYFSHRENRYMNRRVNRPDYVCEQLKDIKYNVQFLYNGDSWSSKERFAVNADPLPRYRRDFGTLAQHAYTFMFPLL